MARKIKFALEMADGTFISNLEDLQKHIKNNDDVKKLVEYFLDGRLERWLEDRYYDEEAKKLQSVDKDDPDFALNLCKSIGVNYTPNESVNIDLIEYEKRMRKALEEVTLESELLSNAGSTASTQSDLVFLLKNGKSTIYLWGDSFKLFVMKNISYIGILGKPLVDIGLPDLEAVESYGIKLENVKLPESILRAEEEKKRKAEEERRRAEEEARRKAEEEARRKAEEEARRKAEEEARRNPFKNAKVGDYVKFGSYPQTSNGQNQPIEWQVLSKENNRMLVISRYGLDAKRFDPSSNVWANSKIRKWLNGKFYNKAFTDQEKKSINLSNLSDVGTTDNVFFLSREEAEKYFVNNDARKCKATDYAKKNGAWVADSSCSCPGYSFWWLRSPYSSDSDDVYDVPFDGCIYCSFVDYDYFLARPALWINLDANENNDTKLENVKLPERFNPNPFKSAKVGDYVKFGNYPQTSNGQNRPIEWQVLSIENNKMLVISRYCLDAKRFAPSSNFWANSEIRKWLNGDFYNKAFTDQEKKSINLSNLSDVGTTDNVFFLSREEAGKYFANNTARKCKATDYAKKNGAWVADSSCSCPGYSIWWLRSPNPYYSSDVYNVCSDGSVSNYYDVGSVDCDNFLARPALWINLDANENNDTKLENVKLPERFNPNPFKSAKVGDYVKFGNYPQTSNGGIQPIEWQVLSKENNKMLVISRYGLDTKRFDSGSNNWANSEIRKWLNGEFYNKAFNEKERKSIKSSNLSDVGTTDNVFLLSGDWDGYGEVNEYFANYELRRCKSTEYAVKNGASVDDNGFTSWWLRSSFGGFPYSSYQVDYVLSDGNFSHYVADYAGGVVLPALWINL